MVHKRFPHLATMVAIASPFLLGTLQAAPLETGPWRAWLDSPGGELPFELELSRHGDAWRAVISNGEEKVDVPQVTYGDGDIIFEFPHVDAVIHAKIGTDGKRLDGAWRKKTRDGSYAELPFHAAAGTGRRFESAAGPVPTTPAPDAFTGKWSVKFAGSTEPAIAVFRSTPDKSIAGIVGTMMTATGDLGVLLGVCHGLRLRLSSFDGGRAMLFDATLQPDGTLAGDFWSRDKYHDTWTARRDDSAELPDGFRMTLVKDGPIDLAALSFKDLDGKSKSLADFGGRVLLIDVFGSWCPNCHDASHFLSELYDRYAARGLAVVGLAFEYSGDFTEDSRQVRRFVERHKSKYPVLLGGVADKKIVAQALPFIEELKAYPTFIIIDRKDGTGNAQVVATYAGFSGPATGEAHQELCRKLTEVVVKALAETSKN